MNKTIIINMNGVIFHIEEDAYEILKSYMTDVKRHFYNSADSLEITTDIENRIAEMFTNILTAGNRQVIVEQDVNEVIAQMGSAKDFDLNEESNEPAGESTVPPYAAYSSRKLFRDPDDHILGGVCAGLASYFEIDTVWVRLAFAVALLVGGTGLLAYVVLWVIIPKAMTRADRMSMRGEPLDLQGFKRNFQEEMSAVKGHLATLHDEAKPLIYKTKNLAGSAAQHTGAFIGDAGRLIAKAIAIVISVFCSLGIASILIGIVAFVGYGVTSFGPGGFENIFPVSVMDYQHNVLFFIAAFFAMAIPLLAIMFVVLNAAFNRARFTKSVGATMLMVWLASVGVVAFYGARLASEFKESAKFTQTLPLKTAVTGVYYLKLSDIKYLSAEDSARLDIKHHFTGNITINNDDEHSFNPNNDIDIYIQKSDVLQPTLQETYLARGNTFANALLNARNTTYQFTQLDSVLTFGNRLQLNSGYLWRSQAIQLTLKLPVNSKIIIDEDLTRYLRDVDFYSCKDLNKNDHDRTAAFKMTADGLQCLADTAKAASPAETTSQER